MLATKWRNGRIEKQVHREASTHTARLSQPFISTQVLDSWVDHMTSFLIGKWWQMTVQSTCVHPTFCDVHSTWISIEVLCPLTLWLALVVELLWMYSIVIPAHWNWPKVDWNRLNLFNVDCVRLTWIDSYTPFCAWCYSHRNKPDDSAIWVRNTPTRVKSRLEKVKTTSNNINQVW